MAAFAVGAVAIAWPLSRSGAEPRHVVAAPAPHASPAGELTVASVETDKKPATKRDKKAAEQKASGRSKYTDTKAEAYFRSRWSDKTAKRVKDIRTEGGYLRIYTNLPENAGNSKTAITLCKRGLEYLAERGVQPRRVRPGEVRRERQPRPRQRPRPGRRRLPGHLPQAEIGVTRPAAESGRRS